jgi:isoleucyl-tRNA synthetase
MNGFNVWDRSGYDMHGLPTEHKVMEKFNLKTKLDIQKFGLEKFSQECLTFSTEMAKLMSHDFIRLGSTVDFSDPYMPIKEDYIEGAWFLIKKAHDKKRLYMGERTLYWCAHCETALSKHECEYKTITDKSIFVKFPIKGKKNEFLIIWTTTPWTLAFNLAVMVNPKLTYLKVKADNEFWIIAEDRLDAMKSITKKDLKIIERIPGKKLSGIEYTHPWEKNIPFSKFKKQSKHVHTILLSEEYVTTDTGSGLVHCAPGCGPEDYEVGHSYGIAPFNTVDERGQFSEEMGPFAGLFAKKDDGHFVQSLQESYHIIAELPIEHEYAHCQRCHQPVIFRTTPQWFFKVEDLKKTMLKANEKIVWNPDGGKNAFTSWLTNLRDNSISKQRFWGIPIPIWQCPSCKELTIIGSIKDLKKKAGKLPKNLHKPWIDELTIPCKCGKNQTRTPDILDVWIDAGSASWNCLNYPQDKTLFKEWFPADFILEGKDQIRGWFNLLMVASFLAFNKPSFKAVYMHGFVTDVEGVKMSKSLGNIISPYEVIDKYSADALRFYTIQTNAGEDINFSWDEVILKHRELGVLWNIHKYLITLTQENNVNPFTFDHKLMNNVLDLPERFIFSKLHRTIKATTQLFEQYRLDEAVGPMEDLFLDLSRTYIQLVRDKSSLGSKEEKQVVLYTISHVLFESLKLFSTVAPFATEAIYQNLREAYNLKEESIHLFEWPKPDEKLIDETLETNMAIAQDIITTALSAREKMVLNVRWPVKELIVATKDKTVIKAVGFMRDIIKTQVNCKELTVMPDLPGVKQTVKPDFAKINPKYKELSPKIIAKLAIESKETMLSHIENEGAYNFTIDGKQISITKNELVIERDIPPNYQGAQAKNGMVYLNKTRTDELEGEGYSREIMRRVQELRKRSSLQKADRIVLYLKTNKQLKSLIDPFITDIQQKVGATKVKIDVLDPSRKHHIVSQEKVKDQQFTVYFDKV